MTRVVRAIERHGGAVIIGRGSYFILAPESALRVRVICPRAAAHRADRRSGRGSTGGRRRGGSGRWSGSGGPSTSGYFGREVDDPHHYDVVVNTGWTTPEAAADVVVAAYVAKFGRCRSPETAA